MEENNKIVRILWTGGWDSTYRIVELSRQDKVVEPIYVYGDQRTSEKKEINAMKEILSQIKKEAKQEQILNQLGLFQRTQYLRIRK